MEGQIRLGELIDALIADFQERELPRVTLRAGVRRDPQETSCESATLVTLREEGSADVAGGTVRIVPAWRWLLEPAAA